MRFRRPDLIEPLVKQTALKLADAKGVVNLVLQELGRALDETGERSLRPLAKLIVRQRKLDAAGPDIVTVKIRRPDAGKTRVGDRPLADLSEGG